MTQRQQEILIGLMVLGGLVFLGVLIVLFGEFRELFRESYPLTVRFSTAEGVRKGTPVFITGVAVGAVEKVTLEADGVSLLLTIDSQYRVAQGSAAAIRRKGILADPFIEFTGGDPTGFVPTDGTAILTGTVSPSIDEAAAKLQDLADRVDEFLGDEELHSDFRSFLTNLSQLSGRGTEVLDRGRELAEELRRFVDLSSQLVEETLALSLDLRAQVSRQSDNLDRLADSLVKNSERLDHSLETAAEILDEIRRGQGSLGKLLTEDELYRQLVETVAQSRHALGELEKTITYFREHPEVLVWGAEPEKKEPFDLWPF